MGFNQERLAKASYGKMIIGEEDLGEIAKHFAVALRNVSSTPELAFTQRLQTHRLKFEA